MRPFPHVVQPGLVSVCGPREPTAYRIERLPEGGYVVTDAPPTAPVSDYQRGMITGALLFACSDIANALGFVERKLSFVLPDIAGGRADG
ncbi:hypothetical protein ACQR1I_16595 [Bradyrhizobium sp. HKCCYLS2038]